MIRLYYLPELDTLDLWLDNPNKEEIAEPLTDNIILKLDNKGNTIGLEILSLQKLNHNDLAQLPPLLRKALQQTLRKLTTKTNQIIQT